MDIYTIPQCSKGRSLSRSLLFGRILSFLSLLSFSFLLFQECLLLFFFFLGCLFSSYAPFSNIVQEVLRAAPPFPCRRKRQTRFPSGCAPRAGVSSLSGESSSFPATLLPTKIQVRSRLSSRLSSRLALHLRSRGRALTYPFLIVVILHSPVSNREVSLDLSSPSQRLQSESLFWTFSRSTPHH